MLGFLANALPLSRTALILVVLYGAYYGLIEANGRPGLPPPGSTWQVPATWVHHTAPWRRMLIWGSILGPGFATRNPYAGFGMLPLTVATVGNIPAGVTFAGTIGALHATGRALALLRDIRGSATTDYLQSVTSSMYWRRLDGFTLLVITGMAIGMIALRS